MCSATRFRPRGSGRRRVRAISASIFCSTRQLIAAAAPATSAMPSVPKTTGIGGGTPGTARNMPIIATKTISDTTRGLVSARNCRKRTSGRASVVMRRSSSRVRVVAESSADFTIARRTCRYPIPDARSTPREILRQPLDVRIGGVASTRLPSGSMQPDAPDAHPATLRARRAATRATTSPGWAARNSGAGGVPPASSQTRTTRSRSLPCIVCACRVA